MNTLKELKELLIAEFGPDPDYDRIYKKNGYIVDADIVKIWILELLNSLSKVWLKGNILFLKGTSTLLNVLIWKEERDLVVEILMQLGIKKLTISYRNVSKSYSLRAIMNVFTRYGFAIEWDMDNERFIFKIN